jgi:DNA-binding CsgD family transcriptional regulator
VIDSLSRQKRTVLQLKKLNPAGLDLDALFQGIFSLVQQEISFRVGWFFPVDPVSLKPTPFSQQIWAGSTPHIETDRIHLDYSLFPTTEQLLQKGYLCSRGEAWWSPSKLVSHSFYRSVLKPEKLYFSLLVLLLDNEKKCRGSFILWREKGDGDFTDTDFALMTAFSPVIGHILQKLPVRNGVTSHSELEEEKLQTLVRRRAQPGILILDQDGQIQYLNHDAKQLLDALAAKNPSGAAQNGLSLHAKNNSHKVNEVHPHSLLPTVVYQLYDQFKKVVMTGENATTKAVQTVNRFCIHEGVAYLLRALLLQQQGSIPNVLHIMILIEKVSQGVRIDQMADSARLTQREQEVVHLLLEGKTNKEVAVCMNIGEYTVKDHVKRIMKKLKVTTRAGIVARILHPQASS